MSEVIATSGDPIAQLHRAVAQSAQVAVAGLPTVVSVGLRRGHAELLESALADTRKTLTELAHVGDVGSAGAMALADQDSENAGRFGDGWDGPEIQVKGQWHGPTRVV